jgi:hypothetical protein
MWSNLKNDTGMALLILPGGLFFDQEQGYCAGIIVQTCHKVIKLKAKLTQNLHIFAIFAVV